MARTEIPRNGRNYFFSVAEGGPKKYPKQNNLKSGGRINTILNIQGHHEGL